MEAIFYESLGDLKVKCNLCNHRCVIQNEKRGICFVRENQNGYLKTLVYGRVIAQHKDPIEKKPLFHFYPGSFSYSIATVGCNFKCRFCQNAEIAHMAADNDGMIMGDYIKPQEIVESCIKGKCKSISYTYTEPTIYFEFAFETAKLAHEKGIKNIFVTNGYMSPEALNTISPYLDAANVDLKAYSDDFYKKVCAARIEPVKQTLKLMKSMGIHVEVTTLIIPGLNDDIKELESLARFIADELGIDTPWHVSRFHPTYKLNDRHLTPVETLLKARDIGIKSGLRYVYIGNIPGENGGNTFCYQCSKLLIERLGFNVRKNIVKDSACPYCGAHIKISS